MLFRSETQIAEVDLENGAILIGAASNRRAVHRIAIQNEPSRRTLSVRKIEGMKQGKARAVGVDLEDTSRVMHAARKGGAIKYVADQYQAGVRICPRAVRIGSGIGVIGTAVKVKKIGKVGTVGVDAKHGPITIGAAVEGGPVNRVTDQNKAGWIHSVAVGDQKGRWITIIDIVGGEIVKIGEN